MDGFSAPCVFTLTDYVAGLAAVMPVLIIFISRTRSSWNCVSSLVAFLRWIRLLLVLCTHYKTTRDSLISPQNANVTFSAQISPLVSQFAAMSWIFWVPEGPIDRLSMKPTLDVKHPGSIITSLNYCTSVMFLCLEKVQLAPFERKKKQNKKNQNDLFDPEWAVATGCNCLKCIPHTKGLCPCPRVLTKLNCFHPRPNVKTTGSSL